MTACSRTDSTPQISRAMSRALPVRAPRWVRAPRPTSSGRAAQLVTGVADDGGVDGGARVVNLREVPAFPIPAVEVGELASMLSSVPVADVSDVALVNMVSAWQQVVNMAQAAQAEVIREIEARTTDALARVPDELACALACTRRAATDLFLRAWGAGEHPVLADAWAAGAIDARKVDVILAEASPRRAGDRRARRRRRGGSGRREMTAPQLTRHVRAALIATDPDAAERRRLRGTRPPLRRARPGSGRDGAPDRLPARRRGHRGVHRDRRPGRSQCRGRRHPDRGPTTSGRFRRHLHRHPGHPG